MGKQHKRIKHWGRARAFSGVEFLIRAHGRSSEQAKVARMLNGQNVAKRDKMGFKNPLPLPNF